MRYFIVPFLLVLGCVICLGAEPADRHIEGALADIEKYEQQFAGATTVSKPTATRTLRLLGLTRQRLDESSNRTHASWIDADQRLRRLTGKLDSFVNPEPAQPPQSTRAAATQQVAQPKSASGAEMISQQRVWIKKLIRDVASATETLDQNGPAPFQDDEYVDRQKAALARFEQSLGAYSEFENDADVIEAKRVIDAYRDMIDLGVTYTAKQRATIGRPATPTARAGSTA